MLQYWVPFQEHTKIIFGRWSNLRPEKIERTEKMKHTEHREAI